MATTKRASSLVTGIGKNLTDLLDKDVVVTKAWIGERNFDGEDRPIVIVTLENGETYHAWSKSLCERISEIPESEYPLTFKFTRVSTRKAGQSVITFE